MSAPAPSTRTVGTVDLPLGVGRQTLRLSLTLDALAEEEGSEHD